MMMLGSVLIPVCTGLLAFLFHATHARTVIHVLGSILTSAAGFWIVTDVVSHGPIHSSNQFFYVDALSAMVIAIISVVSLTAALYSVGYIQHEFLQGALDTGQVRQYYALYHWFVAVMMLVTVVNNLGLVWVAIEGTTIVSAFLIALYRRGEALEAAWKYLILCSAGIAFALLGIILLYMASVHGSGTSYGLLNWTVLSHENTVFEPGLVTLALVFLMVGFGTKVGLAPLHFWLPDAHSQAPSPISALLSAVLLNCALFGLMRFGIVGEQILHNHLVEHLFLGFGLLSIALAVPFLLVQRDMKRMLAFSTLEHMGIITVALGIGGILGFTAAMLQMFNHAMGKSLLFFVAGNITQKYGTKQMPRITGVFRTMPFSATLLLLGTLAVTGAPPLSLFTSEFALFVAGFRQGHPVVTSLVIALLAVVFAAMMLHTTRILFGRDVRPRVTPGDVSRWSTWPLLVPLTFVIVLGVYAPAGFMRLIQQAALVLAGGHSL